MSNDNKLTRTLSRIHRLVPPAWQSRAISFALGRVIPFTGTAAIQIRTLTDRECIILLKNKRKVQNHIGSVHAAAIALLAESATGLMTGMSVPDDRIIVIRSMQLEYLKRASGNMTAIANFSDEQVEYIKSTTKGDITVPIKITDQEGNETAKATMIWAWTLKEK